MPSSICLHAKRIRPSAPVLILTKSRGWFGPGRGGTHVKRAAHEDGVSAGGRQETGPFGPVFRQFRHDADGAIAHLRLAKTGEAIAALHHLNVGDIDLPWGVEGTGRDDGFGLAKLIRWHPEVLDDLQGFVSSLVVKQRDRKRIQLWDGNSRRAVVKLSFDDAQKHWLLTAYEKVGASRATSPDTGALSSRGDTARPTADSNPTIPQPLRKSTRLLILVR